MLLRKLHPTTGVALPAIVARRAPAVRCSAGLADGNIGSVNSDNGGIRKRQGRLHDLPSVFAYALKDKLEGAISGPLKSENCGNCVLKRVARAAFSKDRIVGEIRRVDAFRAQKLLQLFQGLGDCPRLFARLQIPFDLDDDFIGDVETPGKDRGNVKQCRHILAQQRGCLGDVEFGPLQSAHVSGMRLVQYECEFAEDRARLGDGRDLQAVPDNLDHTLPENEKLPRPRSGGQHRLSGFKSHYRKGSETLPERSKVRNKRHIHGPFVFIELTLRPHDQIRGFLPVCQNQLHFERVKSGIVERMQKIRPLAARRENGFIRRGTGYPRNKGPTMPNRFLIVLASAAVLSAGLVAGPSSSDAAKPAFQKLPSSGVKLKNRSGYYVQCYYSGLGEICEYVYARVRTSKGASPKLQRVKVKNGPLKKKLGYYTQCYYSALGEVCETVYMKPRKP